jgi:CRISPR/Cas system CMR subunit Cmr4 (Cas7 group RAMP superfamily)
MTTESQTNRYFHLARFTLEAETALSIGTGSADGVFDTALVRDANGLPAIPGTSLAGVLRHLFQSATDETRTKTLFGHEEEKKHADGQVSRLQVAWGCILNAQAVPVEGLVLGSEALALAADPILGPLLAQRETPLIRNRVRIGHRGAAADKAKFDRAVLPAGHRFACELSLLDPDEKPADWLLLLDLLADPRLRLGGATRAGLGRMRLVALSTASLDLNGTEGAKRLATVETGIGDDTASLSPYDIGADDGPLPHDWVRLDLHLKARDYWRIGQGSESIRADRPRGREDKQSDALPVLEPQVAWPSPSDPGPSQAELKLRLPLAPGSAIKGALSHRADYYANCGEPEDSPCWADNHRDGLDDWDGPADRDDRSDRRHRAIQALFGFSKERLDDEESTGYKRESGLAGRVFIDDVHIDVSIAQVGKLMHNAIDRFTGGVRDRLLFDEDLLWRTPLRVRILVNLRADRPERQADLDKGLAALRLALLDLAEGRLGLGAGSGHGNGYFEAAGPVDLDGLARGEIQ